MLAVVIGKKVAPDGNAIGELACEFANPRAKDILFKPSQFSAILRGHDLRGSEASPTQTVVIG